MSEYSSIDDISKDFDFIRETIYRRSNSELSKILIRLAFDIHDTAAIETLKQMSNNKSMVNIQLNPIEFHILLEELKHLLCIGNRDNSNVRLLLDKLVDQCTK